MIYAIRATSGQEHIIVDLISNKLKDSEGVYGIFIFPDVKGYIFIEAESQTIVRDLMQDVPRFKGVLPKEVNLDEIVKMAEVKVQEIKLKKGDLVEFILGPFRGERAKVIKVDKTKDSITVELIEAAVPVPVTAKVTAVKLIQKAEEV